MTMPGGFFITGTDTDIGKTFVGCALLSALRAEGLRALGMKPVASGCRVTADGLRNDDALALMAAAALPVDYALVNPYAFEPAVAPHLAAQRAGVKIRFERIEAAFNELQRRARLVLVEGVGGWRVPLGPDGDVSDLAARLALPVILVVGLRLGCINHALLTAEAVRARGLRLAGWVANTIDPAMPLRTENLQTLRERIDAPCLGDLPRLSSPGAAAATRLSLGSLGIGGGL